MKTKTLRATGQRVSEIGFGCWQLGGAGWGRFRLAETRAALERGLALGITLFDTAPVYGFGQSETLLGQILRDARSDATVVTKGGLVWDERRNVRHDNRPGSLRRQAHESLRRLQREVIDVYLLHWPDPRVPLAEAVGGLEDLRREGSVRAWGMSNFAAAAIRSWQRTWVGTTPPKAVLEVPWNILDRSPGEERGVDGPEQPLGLGWELGWDTLAYDVLARGLLAGRYTSAKRFGKRDVRGRDPRYRGEAYESALSRVEKLKTLARSLDVPPAAVAIRAALDGAGVTACLVGMKRPSQVEENVRASDLVLPATGLP